jgi:benzil reductase ((S)-benzoin forming)
MTKEIAIISGTTRGIGKALLQELIEKGIASFSINRSSQETMHLTLHRNYSYDLKATDQLDRLVAEILHAVDLDEIDKIYLFNNAAVTGPINPLNESSAKEISRTLAINLISPLLLSNHLINAIQSRKIQLEIIHISSGAAFHPLEGLGSYCISKAGLEMASSVIQEENKEKGVRSVTIGPGVVDTQMQERLRSSDPEVFASQAQFAAFHEKGLLVPPDQIGKKILTFVLNGNYQGGRYYGMNDI